MRTIDLLADAIAQVKEGSDPRTQLEVALLKAARPSADASTEALLTRIERLERGGGTAAPPDEPRVTKAPTPPPRPLLAPTATTAPWRPHRPRRDAPPPLELQRLWPAVLERVSEGEGGEMLAALLADARPVALEEDVLVLAYPGFGFVQQAQDRGPLQRPAARAARSSWSRAVRSWCDSRSRSRA